MGAVFERPTVDEVIIHMQARKPEWPPKFIEYYANKFVNHYQARGWLLTKNVLMKDWRAAFSSQWLHPKYQEDLDMLQKLTLKKPSPMVAPGLNNSIGYLNDVFDEYCRHPFKIPEERLGSLYDYMKEHGLITLTKTEKEIAIKKGEKDKMLGKAQCVKFVFERMANSGKRFI